MPNNRSHTKPAQEAKLDFVLEQAKSLNQADRVKLISNLLHGLSEHEAVFSLVLPNEMGVEWWKCEFDYHQPR